MYKRVGDYAVKYDLADLKEIAAKTRRMSDDFINEEGNNVLDSIFDSRGGQTEQGGKK